MLLSLRRLFPAILLGIITLMMVPPRGVAQQYRPGQLTGTDSRGVGYENPFQSMDDQANNAQQPTDSLKKRKPRKPLESYFFDDSIRMMPNFMWHVSTSRNRVEMQVIDTMLNDFQLDYPYLRHDVGDAYLGNYGGPSVPLNYFRRPQFENFSFADAFYAYLYTPENVPFYNVKAPFTHLNYGWAGQKRYYEENFHILHAQNISPSTGFNVSYKSRGTRGIYQWQAARAKNLSVAVSHTGKKYSAHGGYIYNSQDLRENGGLINDRDITDTIFELSDNVPMKLSDAKNILKNNTFYLVQSYGIPLRRLTDQDFSIADRSSVFVGHSIVYGRFHKVYTDTRAGTLYNDVRTDPPNVYHDYYENWYLHPTETRDSIFESVLSNKVFVQLQPYSRNGVVGLLDAGIGFDVLKFYRFTPEQYVTGDTKGDTRESYYAYGSVQGKIRKYLDWNADLKYHLAEYRSQDLSVGGQLSASIYIKGSPVTIMGRIRHERRSPDYWTENYLSNHYKWERSFSKEDETRIEATLKAPIIGLEVGFYQSMVSNKVYYDEWSLPQQESDMVSVTGLYLRKDFRLGGLHLNNRVMLQKSTDEKVIPVPLATAFLSWFYEFDVVRNVLRVQAGLDGRYNTEYYAFAYNPALTQFYNQREKKIGNYPMVDAFVNAKWKRMRIMVKFQHANEGLFGSRNYFQVLHNPLNQRVLKLGFSWAFYD